MNEIINYLMKIYPYKNNKLINKHGWYELYIYESAKHQAIPDGYVATLVDMFSRHVVDFMAFQRVRFRC